MRSEFKGAFVQKQLGNLFAGVCFVVRSSMRESWSLCLFVLTQPSELREMCQRGMSDAVKKQSGEMTQDGNT